MAVSRRMRYVVANGTFTLYDVQVNVDAQGRPRNGLMSGAIARPSGVVTVVDADFTTGNTLLQIGVFEIQEGIHFAADPASVDNTATALAEAIARLPGYSATAVAADVTIAGPADHDSSQITFTVRHYGTIVNLTLSPTTGLLTAGSPTFGAPGLT
jgi:hypothetical protein